MTVREFEAAVGVPLAMFAHQCHAASLALVKSGAVGVSRVARGLALDSGIGGQHSWVVVGTDCYAPDAAVINPTLWSYEGVAPYIWAGTARDHPQHLPHGSGTIWEWGRPENGGGETITLDHEWSPRAAAFLELLGPLDLQGWAQLAHAPVGGWPAAEIIAAIHDDPRLSARVPIDIVGMVTDRNPGGLYLPTGVMTP